METFASVIADGRARLGLDQRDLGHRVGVGQQAVSRWERGTSRPRRAVVVKVAEVLGLPAEDVLAAAGYVGVVADSVDEVRPAVRPLTQTLPFLELSPERFEFACVDILEHLHPGGHASRYGGSGDAQDGIDLLVMIDGVRSATGQCKRRVQFGPQDVRDAIVAILDPAPKNYLFLARNTATAAARGAVDGLATWELWDGEDLSRYVRTQMSPDERIGFVETYFPNHRESFLGVTRPSPWLSIAQFYAATSGPATFTHSWHLAGRRNELAELEGALRVGDPPIAVMYGRGGIGKTRLLRSIAESFDIDGWPVWMLSQDSVPDPAAFAQLLSYGPSLLIVDDAHARGDLGQIVSQARTRNREIRILIACRPYGRADLARDLARAGFLLSELPSVTLDDLTQGEAVDLAREALGPDFDAYADRLATLSRDCPLVTTIGGQLIRFGALAPHELEQDHRLRERIFDGFHGALVATAAHVDQGRRAAILDAIAVLQPFRSGMDSFREAMAELVGAPYSRISAHLRSLEDSGVLIRRGDSVRIVPDLLGDIILARACFDERSGVDTGYLSEVLVIARDEVLENFFVNVSRVDWQVDNRFTHAATPLWDTINRNLESRTIETYLRILKLLRRVAVFRPIKAIETIRQILDNPVGEPVNAANIPAIFFPTWSHVLDEIPAVLLAASYDTDALPLACAVLWELAQAEHREINQHRNHPLKALQEIVEYDPRKPLAHSIAVLDLAEQWSMTGARISPLKVIEPLVATEGYCHRYRDYSLVFYPFPIRQDAVRSVRRRAIELALSEICSGDARRGVAGAQFIGLALRYPTGNFGRRVESEERRAWDPDFVWTVEALHKALRSAELDPLVYLTVLNAVHWHIDYNDGAVHDAVEMLLTVIPDTIEFGIALLLHDGWGRLIRERHMDFEQSQRAIKHHVERIVAQSAGALDDPALVCLMENRLHLELKVFGKRPSGGIQLLSALVENRFTLAEEVLDRLFENIESPLVALTAKVVDLIGRYRPEALIVSVRRLIEHPSAAVRTEAAIGLASRDRNIYPLCADELDLIRSFGHYRDARIKEAVASAANALAPINRYASNEILASIRFSDSPRAAGDIFMYLTAPESELAWSSLDREQQVFILSELVEMPDIDNYWIMQFLRERSAEPTDIALGLLCKRIECGDTIERPKYYCPVPYHWNEPLAFRDRPDFLVILRELLSWLGQRDTPQRRGVGSDLFAAAVGTFDESVLSLLLETLRTGSELEVRTVADMLESAPNDVVFQHVGFVSEALAAAARHGNGTLTVIQTALWSSAISGIRRGTLGQPYPEDVRLRDEGADIAATFPVASPAARFYRSLSKAASETIARDLESDRADHREW